MKLLLLVVLAFCCYSATYGKRIKKTQKDLGTIQKDEKHQTVKTKKGQQHQKAIIAIEIIDSNDNSTKTGSGRKRTIESSLGYGYQSFFGVQQRPPKYEVYKYSQQDLFQGHKGAQQEQVYHHQQPAQQQQQQDFDIQKSVQYDLGTTVQHYEAPKQQQQQQQNLNQYYQHGTTLFSSLDQNGHVSQLSSEAPQHQGNSMVPVIVLRVYTNQLNQGGELHPNIPQNHPYSSLRSVDLQNLLSGYAQQQQHPQQQEQQHYQEEPQHQQYQQQPQQYQQQYQQSQQYQQPQQYQQQEYQPQYYQQPQQVYYQQPNDGLLTHENYPSNDHTKVIFTKQPNKETPQIPQLPKKFKITIPENTFSKVEVQEHTYEQNQDQNQQLYYYPQPAQPFYEQPQQYQYQYYQNYPDPSQYYQQQQYQYEETQNPPQYTYEQNQQPAPVEEAQHSESSDQNLHKSSKDLGRDLHSKLYNYHAHGPSTTEKKASNKRMTRKRPAVTVEREHKE